MRVELNKPELERFINEQVQAGHFPSSDAVVAAAVEQMILDQEHSKLSEADIKAIDEAESEIDRGEFIEFDAFAVEMRRKFGVK